MRLLKHIVLFVFFFVLSIINIAQAATAYSFSAACPSVSDQVIVSHHVDNNYHLFLPGSWDPSAICFSFAKPSQTITIGDLSVNSGDLLDLSGFLGEKLPMKAADGFQMGSLTVWQGSSIPSLFVQVDAEGLKAIRRSKNNEITEGTAFYMEKDGTVSYAGTLSSFKCRGNNTFSYTKKPYQIKLSEKADLSGMGKNKTWILLANYVDVSLLRNTITLNLARQIGIPHSIESQSVDLYINGEYTGLYLLTEKVQIDHTRIDITNLEKATEKINDAAPSLAKQASIKSGDTRLTRFFQIENDPEDITGGYLFEIEKPYRFDESKNPGFITELGLRVNIKEPTYPSKAQSEYAANLVNDFHNAVSQKDGVNPSTGVYYADYIDMESFALKFLIEEFTKNYDYRAGSQFFYKDSDQVNGKLYAGPCWDYDLTYGVLRNGALGQCIISSKYQNNIYWLLYEHDDFRALVADLFQSRFVPACELLLGTRPSGSGDVLCSLEAYRAEIEASAAMNFNRWSARAISQKFGGQSGSSFDHAYQMLCSFISARMENMATYLLPAAN